MSITIYHNPRCSKSRDGVKLLEELAVDFSTRLYLSDPLSKREIKHLIDLLGISPEDLVRKKEAIFKENYGNKSMTDNDYVDAMLAHPRLIERPIVVSGNKAVIGRPPSLIKDLF